MADNGGDDEEEHKHEHSQCGVELNLEERDILDPQMTSSIT